MSKDQMRLLKYISQVSFALTETNLYLDTTHAISSTELLSDGKEAA